MMSNELNLYEQILFFEVTLPEEELKAKLDRYKEFLITKGSQVMIKNNGKINLAYSIKNFDTAIYIQLTYLGNGEVVKLLNTAINRDVNILRAVTTKLDSNALPELFVS